MNSFPPTVRLLATQVKFQLIQFSRIPVALFFTVLLPLIMLVMFNALFGGVDVETQYGEIELGQFYVGALAAFTVVSGTFTNLANMVPYRRQDGIMKRWRGTPLPRWVYLAGFIGSGVIVAFAAMVLMLVIGVVAYGTEIDVAKLPAALLSFTVGAGAFSALGIAVAGLVRNPEAAPAAANAIVLPLSFISDVFIAAADRPRWLDGIADVFPLRPFVNSVQAAFSPGVEAPALQWGKLAVVAAWGVVGAALAARTFRWEPFAETGPSARRAKRARSDGTNNGVASRGSTPSPASQAS